MKTTDFSDERIIRKFETYPLSHQHILQPAFFRFVGKVKGESILDLGCGGGIVSAELAKRGAHCIGVDSSALFIAKARQKFPHLKFVCSKGSSLKKLKSGTFDKVVMRNVLLNVPDSREFRGIFRESARVLRPEGELIFSALHPLVVRTFKDRVRSVRLPKKATYFDSGMVFENKMILNDFSYIKFTPVHWTLEDISKALESNGFVITELREPQFDGKRYADILNDTLTTPHYLLIKARLEEKRRRKTG